MRRLQRGWLVGVVVVTAMGVTACTGAEPKPTVAEPATVHVMQFNIEYGGTLVDFDSVPAAIEAADADVVALQEAYGNTCRIAKAVGWSYCDRRTQTIARYPLVTPADPQSPEVLVAVQPGAVFGVVNVHLPSAPYGPNRAAAGASEAELVAAEKGRLKALAPALDAVNRLQDDGIPVVLIGDFNAPSHLDWTTETEGLRDQIIAVRWPVSLAAEDAGLVDAYRSVHPDPATDEGLTWPASRPKVGSYNPGPAGKPADRIDLTFVSDQIAVSDSKVVGEEEYPATDISVSPWPGDHRAVVSTLGIPLAESAPYVAPAQALIEQGDSLEVNAFADPSPSSVTADSEEIDVAAVTADVDVDGSASIDTSGLEPGVYSLVAGSGDAQAVGQFWVREPGAGPVLSVGQKTYDVGEPIDVSWIDAPGNKWDWLGVYKRGADPNVAYYKSWAYTDAAITAEATIDAGFNGGAWPLPPGEYDVVLLKDDSYEELARAPFTVKR